MTPSPSQAAASAACAHILVRRGFYFNQITAMKIDNDTIKELVKWAVGTLLFLAVWVVITILSEGIQ